MAIQIHYHGSVTVIKPLGKIVGPNVSELRAIMLPRLEADDDPRILINLEHANRMSSSGLGVLMQVRALAKHKNGRIGIIHINKHITNLLLLSRLSSLFEHFDNEAAAVDALSTDPQTL